MSDVTLPPEDAETLVSDLERVIVGLEMYAEYRGNIAIVGAGKVVARLRAARARILAAIDHEKAHAGVNEYHAGAADMLALINTGERGRLVAVLPKALPPRQPTPAPEPPAPTGATCGTCGVCRGSGRRISPTAQVILEATDWIRCTDCRGTGHTPTKG